MSEPVTSKPVEPRRAYVLELKVEADSVRDLVNYLHHFTTELYAGKISRGVSGGYSSGSVYSLDVDETITHAIWAEANQRYVDWLNERDKAAAESLP